MNRDFIEMLHALSDAGADFLVVGAHALAAHDQPRATEDLDLWVRPSPENAPKVWHALASFGAPLDELTLEDLFTPELVFQIGMKPYRIDIITTIDGVTFDEAWPNRILVNQYGVTYGVIGRDDLIRNKIAAGRPKDLVDVDNLKSQ
ncbi:MAG TPA: hypothetical protein VEK57_12620 [Thermoanaerobaculia bacterium]|nr:hypothetical protein [Thermoanaerobaculia bacterium]